MSETGTGAVLEAVFCAALGRKDNN